MKKILYISFFFIAYNAQNATAQVRDSIDGTNYDIARMPMPKPGTIVTYKKFKKFTGTWSMKKNNVELLLKLELYSFPFKQEPTYYIQGLRGGIKYTENGVEKFNTLNNHNILAQLADDLGEDKVAVNATYGKGHLKHPMTLKLVDNNTLIIIPDKNNSEGIVTNKQFNVFNGLVLKRQ